MTKTISAEPTPVSTPTVQFSDFAVSPELKQRLTKAKFITPTPVQAGAVPPALEGKDVLATAATGTGKTLSFLIPLIHRLESRPSTSEVKKPIRALILLPTRELAMQVIEGYSKIEPNAKKDSVLVVGGLSEGQQLDQLRRGPRLVVATPGRLEDFVKRGEVNLKHVEILVLDEVDRMLDMGFLPSIRRIVGALPKTRQTMCYSATLDANIEHVLSDYVKQPVRIKIGTTSKPTERVNLRAFIVMQDQKLALLDKELKEHEGSFLVFSRTKHGADRIARKLQKLGHDATVIHGDRSQSQRTAALKSFADGNHRILVATDVAARGIDISHIAHVVNYDLPNASDDFVHRIGRTGRAGATGTATTYVMPQERGEAKKLERELTFSFKWIEVDHKTLEKEERNSPVDLGKIDMNDIGALLALETRSWKNDPNAAPAPASKGSGSGGGGRRRSSGRSSSGSSSSRPSSGGRSAGRRRR
ncbi:DEAD/DEAH box helicase [Terriglobus tenax]|uniref:DEAD/DEAH box helicase n=1 Tax=Terriglobus tenax TaxID=1111115 RepID=UPI0021DFCB4E|nr:DEAD/DEAH box helicase [Terriglobus tenax]